MRPESGIYRGTLRHRRFRPKRHEFSYGVFMAFLDIDRIPELMQQAAFAGYDRFNWASFHQKDHFGDPALPLRERLRQDAAAQNLTLPGGPIFLLTNLRYLGYCFNPISLFYCYNPAGGLELILAEVNSTFGENRNYWLHSGNQLPAEHSRRHICRKTMHVSPFMDMGLDYEFVLTEPGQRLVAHMNTLEDGKGFFDATLTLEHRPWNSAELAKALVRHPWMTAKVIYAIHWQALRIYLKGIPVFTHPAKEIVKP